MFCAVAGLIAGGVATFFSVTIAIILTLCLCGRKNRMKCGRRKGEIKGSVSFTEQEKKLLDVSITTTTDRPSNSDSVEQLNQPDMEMLESASIPLELCEPVHITIESHGSNGGNMVPLSVPLTVFPPPPEFSSSVLPAGTFGNIFISVSVSQEPGSDNVIRYPDLLDIPHRSKNASARLSLATASDAASSQSYASFPRRTRMKSSESAESHLRLGPIYDNMGPRVTAGGSSTLSLPEAEETEIPPPPPPPPPPLPPSLCLPLSIDYISL